MRPIFQAPGEVSQTVMTYCPQTRLYILPVWYFTHARAIAATDPAYYDPESSTRTVWKFYSAPAFWGPWHPEKPLWQTVWDAEGFYNPAIVNPWSTTERLALLASGNYRDPALYRLHVLFLDRATLAPSDAKPAAAQP